jgi:hypothetical protein
MGVAACSSDGDVVGPETGSGESSAGRESGTDTAPADTTTSSDEPDPTIGDEDSTATSGDASTSDEGDSSTSTGIGASESIELVVIGDEPVHGWGVFRWEWVDGVASGPVPLVDDGGIGWRAALLFPERRVVMAAAQRLVLGSLDGDPEDVIRLDVPPIAGGPFSHTLAVPGAEAIVVVRPASGTAYRIDVTDGVASAPVEVAHDVHEPEYPLENGIVDPLGRWFAFDIDAAPTDVALARLDDPDPDAAIVLSATAAPRYAEARAFVPDGSGFLYEELEAQLPEPPTSRGLYFVGVEDTTAAAPILVEALDGPDAEIAYLVAHPSSASFVYSAGRWYGERHLSWSSIEDGVAAEAITVHDAWWFDVPIWAPDGGWLTFVACDPGGCGRRLVSFEDGTPSEAMPLTEFPVNEQIVEAAVFSPDSQYLYFEHEADGVREIHRVPLSDDAWGDWQVVAPQSPGAAPDRLDDLSADGRTLLFSSRSGGFRTLHTVDVSGAVPDEPVVVSAPPPAGDWIWSGRLSPDGRFVLYEEATEDFGPDRLNLVHVDTPREAVEVIPDIWTWQVVPPR